MKKAVYELEPLSCPSCIKKIENTVEKIPGVQSVKVLFNSNKVRTEFDDAQVQADAIGDVISKLGYPVLKQKVA